MSNEITHIKRISIQKLWGKFDIEWELNPDVNILSGINGSGKSTVLEILHDTVFKANTGSFLSKAQQVDVVFSNGGGINVLKGKNPTNATPKRVAETMKDEKPISFSFIKTFDTTIADTTIYNRLNVDEKTSLNVQLEILQKEYLSYQIKLSRKKDAALMNGDAEKAKSINDKWYFYKETINNFFAETGKRIDDEANEIAFLTDDGNPLSVFQLSSGEKQLVIILTFVLVQDCVSSIVMLDEPEISLHTDWQHKLIEIIRTLNPNAQLIIATHSPSLIMYGWMDKITTMEEITKK